MVCIALKSKIFSLIIFNFCFVFYISLNLLEFMNKFHNSKLKTYISTNRSDNLKIIGKLNNFATRTHDLQRDRRTR